MQNITCDIKNTSVIRDISFECLSGTIHALLGPNGSGKSSLASAIMGHPAYTITSGAIIIDGVDSVALPVDERAKKGLFLAVQYPYAIPGLTVRAFLKEAYACVQQRPVSTESFDELIKKALAAVGLPEECMYRYLNDGFSGGERKRLECAQILLLRPRIVILDEIDSGLDADGLRLVAQALLRYKQEVPEVIFIIITHYARLLDFMVPDVVHVLVAGKIVAQGDNQLAGAIERDGYQQFQGAV